MDIKFNWTGHPNTDDKEVVENEISGVIQDRDIKPCHPGAIYVSLGIYGPLDNRLEGSAKCQCGKTLTSFKGDNRASRLVFTENE